MKSISKIALAASLGLALTFTLSCSGDDSEGDSGSSSSGGTQGGGSSSSDGGGSSSSVVGGQDGVVYGTPVTYEGEIYQTVVIGEQTWFAKNLNYNASGSKCVGEDRFLKSENTKNCDFYGRLYDWSTAMGLESCNSTNCSDLIQPKHQGICPDGWHIPSKEDWGELLYVASGNDTEGFGKNLKAELGWNEGGNGTDKYGFSALPGGNGSAVDNSGIGDIGKWWTATASDKYNSQAYSLSMSYDSDNAYITMGYKSGLYSVRCVKD